MQDPKCELLRSDMSEFKEGAASSQYFFGLGDEIVVGVVVLAGLIFFAYKFALSTMATGGAGGGGDRRRDAGIPGKHEPLKV